MTNQSEEQLKEPAIKVYDRSMKSLKRKMFVYGAILWTTCTTGLYIASTEPIINPLDSRTTTSQVEDRTLLQSLNYKFPVGVGVALTSLLGMMWIDSKARKRENEINVEYHRALTTHD